MVKKQKGYATIIFSIGILMLIGVLFLGGWGLVHFKLWAVEYTGKAREISAMYEGKAILAEAQHAKMARIEAAKAEKESAQLTADAISIVGEAAKKYPEYRKQEFMMAFGEALREGNIEQIMYIPTEANLPITEAGKR